MFSVLSAVLAAATPDHTLSAVSAPRPYAFFFHIHKCGGSSVCDMAKGNREKIESGGNCNFEGDDFSFLCDPARSAARAADVQHDVIRAAITKGHTFGMDECNAPKSLFVDPSVVRYATSIREPLERSASAYYYSLLDQKTWAPGHTFEEFVLAEIQRGWSGVAANYAPNFLTHYLSGAGEKERITTEHLERAKAFARKLDLVIDVDFLPESMPLMHKMWGWTNLTSGEDRNSHGGGDKVVQLSKRTYAQLSAQNWADVALHRFMVGLARDMRQKQASAADATQDAAAADALAASRSSAAAARAAWRKAFVGDGVTIKVVD